MKNKILDCIRFDDYSDMLDNIFEVIDESEDYISATIVGKYKEISEILNLVISCYAVEIGDISLCSEDCNGYKDEYALAIFNDEDRGAVVCCSPIKTDRGYCGYGGDIVYILDNCNSKVQYTCEDEAKFVVIGEDDCDDECNCECFCDCRNEDNELSTTEKSHYSINGKSVSKQEFDKKYSEIQSKYKKNVKRMFEDYQSFMDDIDNMFNRLW